MIAFALAAAHPAGPSRSMTRHDPTRREPALRTAPAKPPDTAPDGEPERMAGALRISEHRLRTAIAASPLAVFNQDLDLRYTWILNPIPGPYRERIIGKTDQEILERPEDAEALEAVKRQVLDSGQGIRCELESMIRGDLRRFDLTLEPLHDGEGNVVGLTGAALDITDQSRMQEALRQQAAALAEADRRKNHFIAMLAHELRSPMAPIRNALESLSHRRQAADRPIDRELQVIGRQLDHLTRLVDDLLDVARITRGRVELRRQPVDLGAVVSLALETVEPEIRQRGQRVETALPEAPLTVHGDPIRLSQVLSNLLSNASKFSEAGSSIEVHVERRRGEVAIEVRDRGIGMPLDSLGQVFDKFYQMDDSLDRSRGGLGLGLTLVKALTEMHDGAVEVASDGPGQGSVFTVRLPLLCGATADDDAPHPPGEDGNDLESSGSPDTSETSGHAHGVRVVVVDDSVDTADTFAELLALKGHDTRSVHDGPAALELCRTFEPDVVFLDIGLPGMTGYEVAERLRQESEARERPAPLLVAVTGYGQEGSRRRSRNAGIDRHLLKPIDLRDVLALLDETSAKR